MKRNRIKDIKKDSLPGILLLLSCLLIPAFITPGDLGKKSPELYKSDSILYRITTTRQSIYNLISEYGKVYRSGSDNLKELSELEIRYMNHKKDSYSPGIKAINEELTRLQKKAILESPVVDFNSILLVKRKITPDNWNKLGIAEKTVRFGFPSNHECNSSLVRTGYENEIAVLNDLAGEGKLETILKDDGYLGEVDLNWDAGKILFTKSDSVNWKVMEMNLVSGNIRQISKAPGDVDCFDAAYMPNGKIVFGSTASFQSVPCWHGLKRLSSLFLMNNDGSEMRRVCYDQDHDFHPALLSNGQVLYNRWDYTGTNHVFYRQQMAMNPDGTGQRAIYGSNSWFPTSLYFSRETPGKPGTLVSILSGYHGPGRMGQLVVIDTKKGWYEEKGITHRISGRGDTIEVKYYDRLVNDDWPKFATPYPLNDKYFLVSCWKEKTRTIGIYLADIFDNLILIKEIPGYALLEPVPLKKTEVPPVIPDKIKPGQKEAVVYLHNVYKGPGLKGVPEGSVKNLRIIGYHYGYLGLAGPDLIGYSGPWEVMQILGTVPVEKDGSAMFRIPANRPLAFQPVDEKGRALQLMRSWITGMPGEVLSCVGCHEGPEETTPSSLAIAALKQPSSIESWYGPPRGYDFEREVQPVITKYCVECHNGKNSSIPDLRSEAFFPDYKGKLLSDYGVSRMHPNILKATNGYNKYTPAYDVLVQYIRRVMIEDDVTMLTPGEYFADTSPLIQMLKKGHHGVDLSREAWERLYTWIDLNGPCHGTWNDVFPIQDGVCERRAELSKLYGGPDYDPEYTPEIKVMDDIPAPRNPVSKPPSEKLTGWPLTMEQAKMMQANSGDYEKTINIGSGMSIKMMKIPAGKYLMGSCDGPPDQMPAHIVTINKPFWISAFEITNGQYRAFDPGHDSHYYQRRHTREDDRGRTLNDNDQPVVRVSLNEAVKFCEWLSDKTGMKCSLPTETQWEYACRGGSSSSFSYGNEDFSRYANLADTSFGPYLFQSGGLIHLILEGASFADLQQNDNFVVTAPVGSFRPNAWGLYDMHGNASEWTLSDYVPYSFTGSSPGNEKVVRGGSFFDNPQRAGSAFRLSYEEWQKIFNVGFRVVIETNE